MKTLPKQTTIALGTLITVLLIGFLAHLLVEAQSAVDPTARTVLMCQQAYSQNITSLEVNARFVLHPSNEPATNTIEHQLRVVTSGPKYRADFTYVDIHTGKTINRTTAYNDELYQLLQGDQLLQVSHHSLTGVNVYANGLHPLVTLFRFALSKENEHSLVQLQRNDTWSRLLGMVVGSEDATMHGHDGIKLKLKIPSLCCEGEDSFEVFFASDLDYLPVYWRGVAPSGEVSECKVLAIKSYDHINGPINIPIRLEFEDYFADGTSMQDAYMEIDPQTLRVNQWVDEILFTIPRTSARLYFNADTGVMTKH